MHQGQDDQVAGKEARDAVLLAFPTSSSPYTASAVAACGLWGASLARGVPGETQY
jgi:hypothetical protein